MFVVYEIECKPNGRKYFGRSQEVQKRWRAHRNMLRKGAHSNSDLQRDWEEFGEDNFKFRVLQLFDNYEESVTAEQHLIDSSRGESYNIANSTYGGDTFTFNPRKEEIRRLRREQMSGSGNPMFGREKSDFIITRIKEANSKRIRIEGNQYASTTEASKILGVGISTIHYRLNAKSDKYRDWVYVDEEMPNDYRNHA
ncbi:GIY-YIG nuclease family protein [Paenibacillus sp. VCA1]|uniref:GIY-YIG nuclease family protein n=1 Tax=Paenibacillus sp. VCA1 TaxID=3039148 RepID=UPI00287222E8|nr:GIY-YIG nuclease family protein [Paenibacillus sp. VCA1]MDR9852932.1 GIY-YIG nuclease family protein [Paenibacillus sp. VCA1]